MNISLHSFSKQHNLPKSSVYDRAKSLGIKTSNGLTEEDQTTLLRKFGKQTTPQVTIDEGSHRNTMTLQVGCDRSSLEPFRTDRTRQALANPREFMTGLTSFLDQLEEGMVQAEAEQELELQTIRHLKRKGQKRLEQFRRRADEYRIKTDLLACIQNAELDDLQALTQEANTLGKLTDSGQG